MPSNLLLKTECKSFKQFYQFPNFLFQKFIFQRLSENNLYSFNTYNDA